MVTDCVALFNSLLKYLNPTKISMFTNWMVKQGRELWMQFKAWYWGLNCDKHMRFVRMMVPVVPQIDAKLFDVEMDKVVQKTDDIADEPKLEECLIVDMSINREYNQVLATRMKKKEILFMEDALNADGTVHQEVVPVPPTGLEVDEDEVDEEKVFDEEMAEIDGRSVALSFKSAVSSTSTEDEEASTFKIDRKAMRQQRHQVREGMMEAACRAVEIRLRVRHGLVPSNELNEQALRMTALEICREYNINEADTLLLTNKPVWKAMIPDQMQMDALRIIYNGETQSRLNTVEMLRNSAKFSVFNLQPNC